jgi:PAS domain S-box-containing protein
MKAHTKTEPVLSQELISLRQRIEQLESQRQKMDEKLRECETRFKDLYDMAPVGYHEYDTEGRITFVNQTGLDMLGYSREEIIGQYIWSLNIEQVAREQVLAKLAGELPPGRQLERTYRRKDGTPIPVLIEDRFITDEHGKIKGIRCTIQNLTESKRIEAETAALAEIGRLVSSTLNIEEVYEKFAVQVRNLIPFDRIHVNLNSPDGEHFTTTYVSGFDIAGRRPGDKVPLAGSISEAVIRSRVGLYFHPTSGEAIAGRFSSASASTTYRAGMHSFMAVPLIYRNEVIGTLHFRSKTPNAYTEKDLRVAERIGVQIAGAIGSAELYSDQRRTEEALKEGVAKFRGIYEESPIGIELYDCEGTLLDLNRACLEIFGISDTSVIKGFKLFEDPNLSEELKAQLRKGDSVRYEVPFDFEKVNALKLYDTTKSGTIYLDLLITPLRGVTKEFDIGYLVHVRDITQRKQAENALAENERRLKLVTDNVPALIGYVDRNYRYQFVNMNYERLFGRTQEAIIGTSVKDFLPQGAYDVSLPFINRALAGDEVTYEVPVQLPDGTTKVFYNHLVPDVALNGETRGYYILASDITELKRAEEEQRNLMERLQRAEKMEAIGTLAGGVAHDLNNLLGVLMGNAELLNLGMSKMDPKRDLLRTVISSAEQAAAEVQDLLTMARRGVVIKEQLSLNRIVADQLKTPEVRNTISSHPHVSIETHYDQGRLDIIASAVQIERALTNVISNALNAIPVEGKITIRTENRYLGQPLMAYEKVPKGEYAVLIVSDTGCGIPPDHMEHLFEPFYMRKALKQGGTGLGLAVIWGALKEHDGYIDVSSEPGAGTTFTLYFPVNRDASVRIEEHSVSE